MKRSKQKKVMIIILDILINMTMIFFFAGALLIITFHFSSDISKPPPILKINYSLMDPFLLLGTTEFAVMTFWIMFIISIGGAIGYFKDRIERRLNKNGIRQEVNRLRSRSQEAR